MQEVYKKIDDRILKLKKIVQDKKKSLKKAPKGVLNVHSSKGRVQFYYKESSEVKERRYLKEKEKKLVKELCQKDYDQKVLSVAQIELKALERLQKIYKGQVIEEVFENMNIHRQKHITPVYLPDDEFVKNWESVTYEHMYFSPGFPEYYTDKRERVRSKSEILIANALKNQGVPYRYEYPLYLEDYRTLHPDFMVLNIRTRKEMFWEHFGMMDNPEYAESAIKKIETYGKNGIFLGKNLIATFESKNNPLNIKMINLLIEQNLK